MTADAADRATPASTRRRNDPPRSSPLAGFSHQLRFMVRRDRVRAPVWFVSIVGLVVASASSVLGLYSTSAELQNYADIAMADTAVQAITGPGFGLSNPTEGAVVMNETQLFAFIGIALMSFFMVVRHTRDEEEANRAELVRAAPVGRLAPLAAACTWVGGINVGIGLGLTVGLVAVGLPLRGSVAFSAAGLALGLVFVGLGAVAAQVASTARAARGAAGAALGAFFALRAVGDISGGTLSWASPLGWAQRIRAYDTEQWWVLALLVLTSAALLVVAVVLSVRRDLGGGILPQRPGPAEADPRLSTPLALAIRLQRTSVIGWAFGVAITGLFFGLIADQADQLAENDAVVKVLEQAGHGSLTESFLATLVLMVAIVVGGFAVGAVLRLRTEEQQQRADPVLATRVSRRRWLFSHVAVAGGGSLAIMALGGLTMGLGYAIASGDDGEILPLIAASLAMVPALWVLSALTAALIGLRPSSAFLAWVAVAITVVAGFLAETLALPQWLRDLSPFQHVPLMPAASFEVLPIVLLSATAIGLVGLAMAALDRRDIAVS